MKAYKKILILGSGALKIGEAGEFDYSGSQAIKALKEEGIRTVLINPNIATIQTSKLLADEIYFLPVTPFFVEEIIKKEKPDGILLSFGGQTALNCGLELYKNDILKNHKVQVLGSPVSAIELSEDRQKFADHLHTLGIKTPPSKAAKTKTEAHEIAKEMGYPVMVRAGFALGGQGSGIAHNEKELSKIAEGAFAFVKQILVEKYLHHFKEIEYEVVRDQFDNCVTVCNMENMDPLGIHTGESIVVAPSQTLTNYEFHNLRDIAIKIVRSLKIVGECNVQFALNPNPKTHQKELKKVLTHDDNKQLMEYYVIELNARLSRSSALASKATGYPLAYVAAKLALGKNLTKLQNKVTKATQFCFEPALDYLTVKIPRWDINKFRRAEDSIGSSMKSVGEVMGIGRTFEEAYQKAIRMLDLEFEGAVNERMKTQIDETKRLLKEPTPQRMFAISRGFHQGMTVDEIKNLTGIDPWFLYRIENIVNLEKQTEKTKSLTNKSLLRLKQLGFSDKRIGMLVGKTGLEIRNIRKKLGIKPFVFQIDTLAGEFPAATNYLYMTYNGFHNDVEPTRKKGVIVLGSGPYRIGSSVEFDWSTVNTALSLKDHHKKSIMVNCNPETVSTDYDISDRLYFEELTFERIADIYDFENPHGVIISVGGQTPNNRAQSLENYGCKILGTSPKDIDRAEDRSKFSALLDRLKIKQPQWDKFVSLEALKTFCKKVGYPVLLRPSYVLSGTLMRICHNETELNQFIEDASLVSSEHPITVSKFIEDAKEIELDAVASNGEIVAYVISDHVENAGVHSGDASIALPAQKIYIETKRTIENITKKLSRELNISGPFNIQFLAKNNNIFVIEVNLRASRTFPFISKVTGIEFIKLAVDAFFSKNKKNYSSNNKSSTVAMKQFSNSSFVAVKVPQFSFARIKGADPQLHVEMASTGEVACFGNDLEEAFLKGELAVGGKIPKKGIFISLGGDQNKISFLESAKNLSKIGLPLFATENTEEFLRKHSIKAEKIHKLQEDHRPNILDIFQEGKVDLAINITDIGHKKDVDDDYVIRRLAVDHNIPLFTNTKKAELFVKGLTTKSLKDLHIKSWSEYIV